MPHTRHPTHKHPHLHAHAQEQAESAITLDKLPVRTVATIQDIKVGQHHDGGALKRRLMELGFVPGEQVQVLRRVFAGRGPLAVRVGTSTFAMRRLESSLIEVVPA
jgi:ferrous iron transport protein A